MATSGSLRSPHCVFCCFNSLTHPTAKSARLKQDSHGLTCSKCSRFACNACLEVIQEKIAKSKHLKDEWCKVVKDYLNGMDVSSSFIGHCCEWQLEPKITNPFAERRFDGFLFLPEYAILISPNINGVDIHAFGKDRSNNLNGVMHAVVDEYVSVQCKAQNIVPDRSAARIVDLYSQTVKQSGCVYLVRNNFRLNDCIATQLTISNSGQHNCCWTVKAYRCSALERPLSNC